MILVFALAAGVKALAATKSLITHPHARRGDNGQLSEIAAIERKLSDQLPVHDFTNRGVVGFQYGSGGRHRDGVCYGADLKREINTRLLVKLENNAVFHGALKPSRLHRDRVRSDLEGRQDVAAGCIRGCGASLARFRPNNLDSGSGYRCARRIDNLSKNLSGL